MAQPSNAILAVLFGVGVITGGACLVLTRSPGRPALLNPAQTVERVNTALPDPVPGERFVPYVWRLDDLYARAGGYLVPRQTREVAGGPTLTWDGLAKFLQVSADHDFNGERRHWQAEAGRLHLAKMFTGKNFWRVSEDGRRWSPAREFEVEPEFVAGAPRLAGGDTIELSGFVRYVVEYSAEDTFTNARALVISGSTFRPGARGFVRARGLNTRNEVSALSPVLTLP